MNKIEIRKLTWDFASDLRCRQIVDGLYVVQKVTGRINLGEK